MPRLQNWYDSYNDARKAASQRKQHGHKVAKIFKKHNSELIGYYVGKDKHIKNLRDTYKIQVMS